MQINELFEKVKSYADKIAETKPYYSIDSECTLCIIVTDTQELYSGVSSIKVNDNGIENVPAEFNAIMSMIFENKSKVSQMAIISIADKSPRMPADNCLDFILRIDDGNSGCEILAAEDKCITAGDLKTAFTPMSDALFSIAPETDAPAAEESSGDENAEETKSEPELGVPAEFVSGFDFDETNPFYEPETTEDSKDVPPPVQAITDTPINPYGDAIVMNGGSPQQMGGFPQQPMGGYPQQPYQQPMGGYPQQPYQQPMGGYPQQPYQQPMGGYPQQPYQQPMGGYPQQPYQQPMGGYPQQPYQQPVGGYSQQFYQQPMDNAAPYAGNVGTASVYSQTSMPFQPQSADTSDENNDSSMMKQRIVSLLGDSQKVSEPTLSKEEMMKRAKEMKKAAKQNEKMKKRF